MIRLTTTVLPDSAPRLAVRFRKRPQSARGPGGGGKPSYAAGTASSVNAVIGIGDHDFDHGEGIIRYYIENTVKSIGRNGRAGTGSTDADILNIITDRTDDDKGGLIGWIRYRFK